MSLGSDVHVLHAPEGMQDMNIGLGGLGGLGGGDGFGLGGGDGGGMMRLPPDFVRDSVIIPLFDRLEASSLPLPGLPRLEAMPLRQDIARVCGMSSAPTFACFAVQDARGWNYSGARYEIHDDFSLEIEHMKGYIAVPPGLAKNVSAKRLGKLRAIPLLVAQYGGMVVGNIIELCELRDASAQTTGGLVYVRVVSCKPDGVWSCVRARVKGSDRAAVSALTLAAYTIRDPLKLRASDFGASADRVRISRVWKKERAAHSIITMKEHSPHDGTAASRGGGGVVLPASVLPAALQLLVDSDAILQGGAGNIPPE